VRSRASGDALMVTLDQLAAVMPRLSRTKAQEYLLPLNVAMAEFEINTPGRVAAFLAQAAHESGHLRYWRELPHTNRVTFFKCKVCEALWSQAQAEGKPFPGHSAGELYEGRRDLGNTQPGDGVLYEGRGPLQLTGRANYLAASKGLGLGVDLVDSPAKVEFARVGFRVATWTWASKRTPSGRTLSAVADDVAENVRCGHVNLAMHQFQAITRAINGGLNGKAQRDELYARACKVFGLVGSTGSVGADVARQDNPPQDSKKPYNQSTA
jgi:predicted chitinase